MNAVDALTKRQAYRIVRECADAVIEQRTRQDKGWDKGRFRDNDVYRRWTIEQEIQFEVSCAFGVALAHA